jgi:hypothetical protein
MIVNAYLLPDASVSSPVELTSMTTTTADFIFPRARVRDWESVILPTPTAVRYVPQRIPFIVFHNVYRLNAVLLMISLVW